MIDNGPALPPLRVWGGVAGAALVGGALIPSGPPGVGFLVTGAAIAAGIGRAKPRPLDLESGAFAAAALVLLGMAAVLDAPWVLAVDVAAAAVCSALAVTGARTWIRVLAAPFFAAGDALRVPLVVLRSLPRGRPAPWAGPAGRAAVTSLLLLGIFGALFSSADAAFAQIAEDVLFPDVALDVLPARVFVALAIAAGAGGLILTARRPPAEVTAGVPQRRVTTLEWSVPLAALDVLFAAFVLVQLTVLFGGHDHVLETAGLTYAQYARAGFFQLVLIAALVLGVIAVAVNVARPAHHERLLRTLLGILCVLTLVVLASALRRMNLYEDAYGLTRIRVSVYAVDLWLGGIFALVIAAGLARKAPWLPRAAVALTICALIAFNVANPERLIAASAVERWEETGEIDRHYLATLSADGLGPLTELPREVGGCIAAPIAERARSAPRPWSSFNLSRRDAFDLTIPEGPICI